MERKKSILFWSITFGTPVILGIMMGIVFYSGNSTGIFPVVWMFLPAAAVMIGQLVAKKKDDGQIKLPKRFIITFLVITVVEIIVSCLAFFMEGKTVTLIGNIVFMAGSVLSLIFILTEKKETRKAYGLSNQKIGKGIIYILIFLVIYLIIAIGPVSVALLAEGEKVTMESLGITTAGILNAVSLPFMFFLTFLPYFGEEYGWRYYLLPRLMRRFGGRSSLFIVGVVWGLWHVPINMFFYSPDTAVQSILTQVIACIGFSVYFAYAYMKTDGNIWVAVAIHFLNNNLAASFGGGDGSGKEYSWISVAIAAAVYIILLVLPFIFSKTFSKANTESFVTRMLAPAVVPDTTKAVAAEPVDATSPATSSISEEEASDETFSNKD